MRAANICGFVEVVCQITGAVMKQAADIRSNGANVRDDKVLEVAMQLGFHVFDQISSIRQLRDYAGFSAPKPCMLLRSWLADLQTCWKAMR